MRGPSPLLLPYPWESSKYARKLESYTLIYTLLSSASAGGGLTVNVDRLGLVYFRRDAQLFCLGWLRGKLGGSSPLVKFLEGIGVRSGSQSGI